MPIKNFMNKYSWIPAGITPSTIDKFFAHFPPEQIPHTNSDGATFWHRLFLFQYPKTDISPFYCKSINSRKVRLYKLLLEDRNRHSLDIGETGLVPRNNQKCAHCQTTMPKYSMAVFAHLLSPSQNAFHPACFRCSTCGQLLAYHIYCVHQNKPHCERHYLERFLPRCAACEELILSNVFLKELSQNWHMEHFNCWHCDVTLVGSRYVVRDDRPYCVTCFEQHYSNVCDECQKPIGINSKDLSYKERHWHEDCFVCNKCKANLVDKPFGSKSEKIFCGECYDQMFASRCDKCDEVFRAGQRKLEYKGKQWHDQCFVCKKCLAPIGTKSFVPKENDIFCSECYETKFATRCIKCCEIIHSHGVVFKEEPWHKECFTCAQCNQELASSPFLVREDKPYCKECYTNLFSNKCEVCTKPITGTNGTKLITYENRYWHTECFACIDCKTPLEGKGFIKDGPDIICGECAKAKLASL